MIRLIATDMDDTLLAKDGSLHDRTVSALRAAMERGILVTLASGRMLPSVTPYAELIGVNAPMILFNGALAYDHRTGETLFADTVPMEKAKAIARAAEEKNLYIQAYSQTAFYCEEKTEHTLRYTASVGVESTPVGKKLSGFIDFSPFKLLAIGNPAEILSAQAEMQQKFPDNMNFMQSKPHYLEIVSGGVDKGKALKALAAKLGVRRDEILAFGDGQNDVTMLQYAGHGYAMAGSAADKLGVCKSAPSCDEDGVAQVIEHYLAEGVV